MSTVIHAGGGGLVPAADFLSPYDFFCDLTNPLTEIVCLFNRLIKDFLGQ